MKTRGWSQIVFCCVFFFSSFLVSCASAQSVEDNLKGEGQIAEVHGAPHDLGHYVATVRDPEDFFKFEFYSLLGETPEVKEVLAKIKRHDKIRVWGTAESYGPQKHIKISKIVIETETDELPKYERKAEFPESFPDAETPFRALVHAIVKDQGLLVVEYKDAVLPVRVPASIELPELYKNDIIEMKARITAHPGSPAHLKVSEIALKEAIVSIHEKPIEKTGVLVKFPKSPQIKFDIYALKEDLADGLSRQYTLINFDNQELYAQMREKLASFWDNGDQTQIKNGRNMYINPSVVIKAKGIGNVVSPGQANPQILLSKLEDIELVPQAAANAARAR